MLTGNVLRKFSAVETNANESWDIELYEVIVTKDNGASMLVYVTDSHILPATQAAAASDPGMAIRTYSATGSYDARVRADVVVAALEARDAHKRAQETRLQTQKAQAALESQKARSGVRIAEYEAKLAARKAARVERTQDALVLQRRAEWVAGQLANLDAKQAALDTERARLQGIEARTTEALATLYGESAKL